jgi:hydrogenase-1 operon protein HyaE
MNIDTSNSETLVRLPVQPPKTAPEDSPLVARLVTEHGATWVDETSIDDWAALGGDRVVLFAGDAVRFPEGQDVAVVLPELRRSASRHFEIAVVPRHKEDAVARRYGSNRWPTLMFMREGQYVTTLSGMHDWDIYLNELERSLVAPISRAPTIGIPVVSAAGGESSCH